MRRQVAFAALALAAGCTTVKGEYDPRRFADWPIDPAKRLDGCAVVVTSAEEDALVWRGKPTGFTGWAATLEVPLGVLSREAAVRVFGEVFRDGAERAVPGKWAGACRVLVSPRPTRFSWTGHFLGSPTCEVSVRVEARDAVGRAIVDREYDSKACRAAVHDVAGIAAGAQVAIQALMLRAAADVKAELEREGGGASPAGAPSPATGS